MNESTPNNPADSSKATAPGRRHFTLIFVLVMGAASLAVFFAFRNIMRESVAQRSEVSRAHLLALHKGLKTFAAAPENGGAFPGELSQLFPKQVSAAETFFHPAWPERPGYVYVPGVRSSDEPETVVIYENIPAGRERLPRLVLTLSGAVLSCSDMEFQKRLEAQASLWRTEKRLWQPQPVKTEHFNTP